MVNVTVSNGGGENDPGEEGDDFISLPTVQPILAALGSTWIFRKRRRSG